MKPRGTVLVVDDDEEMRFLLEDQLREARYDVISAANGPEALDRLGSSRVDVLVTDNVMPGMKGVELLSEVRSREPEIPVVIITAFGSIEYAVDAMRAGAYHYVAKPFRMDQLLATVESAMRDRRMWHELASPPEAGASGAGGLVGESPAIRKAIQLTLRAATVDTPVLLLGESGTGKELLARTLHAGGRRNGPFIAVNCSAIPETLLESQLFGHRRGAFTDAREDHAGLFRQADGGTILLDEIGDMPAALQGKLLRVLQEKVVHPLGADATLAVDVRTVAATHRDLEALVRHGQFRQDLYYRLNVIVVRVPPLRERMEDLVPLVAHFLEKHGRRLGRPGCVVTPEAMDALRRHSWPGNVRELENTIERGLVLGRGNALGLEDLPPALRARPGAGAVPQSAASLAEMEREHILRTLRAAGGNRAAAARLLGVDRKTLYRKLKGYGIRLQ
jgi:two-component system, NtrC family, response regulator AtoC